MEVTTMAESASTSEKKKLTGSSSPAVTTKMTDQTFKGLGNLIKLLPSGTVFVYQFLDPIVTNSGSCNLLHKFLTGVLLFACGFSCFFSTFTDSYTETDGKVYYGLATPKGLWAFLDPDYQKKDLSKYRLRFADYVHAFLGLIVFLTLAVLDKNTAQCYVPSFNNNEGNIVVKVLPTAIGGFSSVVFMVFPNHRHGIGYPATVDKQNRTT